MGEAVYSVQEEFLQKVPDYSQSSHLLVHSTHLLEQHSTTVIRSSGFIHSHWAGICAPDMVLRAEVYG